MSFRSLFYLDPLSTPSGRSEVEEVRDVSFLSLPVLVHQPSHSQWIKLEYMRTGSIAITRVAILSTTDESILTARIHLLDVNTGRASTAHLELDRIYGDTGAQYSSALGPKFIDSRCKEGENVKAWVKPEYRRNTVSSSCSRSTLMPFVPMCCSMVYPNNLQPLWMESEMRVRIPASKTSELFVLGINVAATVTGSRRKTIGMTQRCLDLESVLSVVIPYLWQ